jgi:hypothetical protein
VLRDVGGDLLFDFLGFAGAFGVFDHGEEGVLGVVVSDVR